MPHLLSRPPGALRRPLALPPLLALLALVALMLLPPPPLLALLALPALLLPPPPPLLLALLPLLALLLLALAPLALVLTVLMPVLLLAARLLGPCVVGAPRPCFSSLAKYFCACVRHCVAVRVPTTFRTSHHRLPCFFQPARNL